MTRLEVVPLPLEARVAEGDDLARLLLAAVEAAGESLRDGDVVCIASKVVSKVEGAYAQLPEAPDVHASRRRLTLQVAERVVAETPWVLVVETRHGFVCANAGIDTSNVSGRRALLLPHDPDAAAASLRDTVRDRTGADVAIVVTDTFGRPWRMGQTDVALGAAGITALRDDRGTTDLEGNTLEVTMIAVADEVAAAADLVRQKADGTPFVLLRGLDVGGHGSGRDLVRLADEDVFRTGGPTTVETAIMAPASPWWPVDGFVPDADERALLAATHDHLGLPLGTEVTVLHDDRPADLADAAAVLSFHAREDGEAVFALGRAVERARLVLEAHGLAVTWHDARAQPEPDEALAGLLVGRRVRR